MDERPIDPFSLRDSGGPPAWPPPRVETDTAEVPVVAKPPPKRRGVRVGALGFGVTGLLVITVAFFVFQPDGATGSPDTSDGTSGAGNAGSRDSRPSSSSSAPKSQRASTEEPPPAPESTDESAPKTGDSAPSRPTKFGAWFAQTATYEAKWQAPADDGGADIVSYVVGDCQGNNLTIVDSNTFEVTVSKDHLDCMSVYAVNSAGLGTDAQHPIANNP